MYNKNIFYENNRINQALVIWRKQMAVGTLFENVNSSRIPFSHMDIDAMLDNIQKGFSKNHVERVLAARKSGKYNTEKSHLHNGKPVNLYNLIKLNAPVFCFNQYIPTKRAKASTDSELSGYVYFDVDGLENAEAVQSLKDLICSKLQGIYAVWTSFGGNGIGGLIHVDGLVTTAEFNRATKWISVSLAALGVETDPACKDYTRVNVISFDPDIARPKHSIHIGDIPVYDSTEDKSAVRIVRQRGADGELLVSNDPQRDCEHGFALHKDKYLGNGHVGNQFALFYASYCNHKGVDEEFALDYAIANLPLYDEDTHRYIYAQYSDQFATRAVVHTPLISEAPSKREFVIRHGQRLNDVLNYSDLQGDKIYLTAPTGSGKTYFFSKVAETNPIVLFVPTTGLMHEVSQKYGAKCFYEHSKVLNLETDRFIVACYQSASSLFNLYNVSSFASQKFTFVIDEAHNIATSTLVRKSLNKLINTVAGQQGIRIILTTGTEVQSAHPFLSDVTRYYCRYEKAPTELTFNMAYAKKRATGLYRTVKDAIEADKTVMIALRSKGERLQSTVAMCVSIDGVRPQDIAVINSDKKLEPYYKKIVHQGNAATYKIIIATDVLKEGTSITEMRSDEVVVVSDELDLHALEARQFATRFRNAKKIEFVLVKVTPSVPVVYEGELLRTRLLESTKAYADVLNATRPCNAHTDGFLARTENNLRHNMFGTCLKFEENEVRVDYLAISNRLHQYQIEVMNKDHDYFKSTVSVLGFTVLPDVQYQTEIPKNVADNIKDVKEMLQSEHDAYMNELVKKTIDDGFITNNKILNEEGRDEVDPKELSFRSAVNICAPYFKAFDEAVLFARESLNTRTKCDMFIRNRSVYMLESGAEKSGFKSDLIEGIVAFKKLLDVGTTYEYTQLMAFATSSFTNIVGAQDLTPSQVRIIITSVLSTKKFTKTVGGKKKTFYTINHLTAFPEVDFSKTYPYLGTTGADLFRVTA